MKKQQDERLMELRKNFLEAEQTVKDTQTKLAELQVKATEADRVQSVLTEKLQATREAKEKSLNSYVLGEIPETEVREASKRAKDVEIKLSENEELLRALTKAAATLEQRIPVTHNALQQARSLLWEYVRNRLLEELKDAVGDRYTRLWAVSCLCGGASREILTKHFIVPNAETNRAMQQELTKEILGVRG